MDILGSYIYKIQNYKKVKTNCESGKWIFLRDGRLQKVRQVIKDGKIY